MTFAMLFAQRYRIEAELGRGAAARVVRARDLKLDRDVALKLLHLEGAIADAERFRDEARVLANLKHPNIVQLLDFGIAEGQHYLVLEYAGGGTLHPLGGQVDVPQAIRLACQVLEALRAGHRLGVVHRDVKPGNVLLTMGGEAKLSDFGLARFVGRSVKTATGLIVGTPQFMAPELFQGKPATPASDRYAWGCLFHHLLSGTPPVDGDIGTIASVVASGTWRPTLVKGPAAAAIAAAMAHEPSERPDAGRLLDILAGPATQLGPGARQGATESPGPAPTLVLDKAGPSREQPRSADRPNPGRSGYLKGLGLFAFLATAAVLWPDPEVTTMARSPSASLAAPEIDTGALLRAWQDRDIPGAARRWVADLHGSLVPLAPDLEKDIYGGAMRRHARGRPYPGVDEVLAKARAKAPYLAEFERDQALLKAVLRNDGLPFQTRWRLYRVLQSLVAIDAYLEAWGGPPAYPVRPVLSLLVDIRDLDVDRGDPMRTAPDAPRDSAPAPGRYRIHRWPADWSEAKYVIVPDPDNGNGTERLAWMVASMTPQEHGVAAGVIDLGQAPTGAYGSITLELTIANLLPPNLLTIRWNDFECWYRTPQERLQGGTWRLGAFPDHRVSVRLPLGMWKAGVNTLEIRTRPLPGMRHSVGPNLDRVGIVLGPPRS
jgi:serine/threonine protein kinase